jgi:C-terminal processing protease CtpA/Prc
LGSYVAGAPHEGKVLFRTAHNPDYAHNDGSYTATLPEGALALPRAYFLVGPQTASASEAVINGLEPYLDITLVGEQTYGKPVGSTTRTHCDDAVTPITFRVVNSRGKSDYFEGLPVDCAVPDDLERELGDTGEARFAAALALMDGAECPLATPSSWVPRVRRAVWVGPWASSVRE